MVKIVWRLVWRPGAVDKKKIAAYERSLADLKKRAAEAELAIKAGERLKKARKAWKAPPQKKQAWEKAALERMNRAYAERAGLKKDIRLAAKLASGQVSPALKALWEKAEAARKAEIEAPALAAQRKAAESEATARKIEAEAAAERRETKKAVEAFAAGAPTDKAQAAMKALAAKLVKAEAIEAMGGFAAGAAEAEAEAVLERVVAEGEAEDKAPEGGGGEGEILTFQGNARFSISSRHESINIRPEKKNYKGFLKGARYISRRQKQLSSFLIVLSPYFSFFRAFSGGGRAGEKKALLKPGFRLF